MKARVAFITMAMVIAACIGVLWLIPRIVGAHCDTMSGPVVMTAKTALEKGDVTPVLKWVKKENEAEIREAFTKTLNARKMGLDAKEVADMYFFETLVRLHRAGEGAPYTGLKPAGTDLGPTVTGADKALENGSVDDLVKLVTDAVSAGIHERFVHAMEKKKHVDESVETGREYVEAYVTYVHYVERLYNDAKGESTTHGEAEGTKTEDLHQH
jgi:hypothetical protein